MKDIRTAAAAEVAMVNAEKRRLLRKWLNERMDEEELPEDRFFGRDVTEMAGVVDSMGGDSKAVLKEAQDRVLDKIYKERDAYGG